MKVTTRFAPSPTGSLHIGSARTALFNYLFARRYHGRFLLRIEDTDRERNTQAAQDSILESLRWLDLLWDGEIVYQSSRIKRHQEIARHLVNTGKAYYCFTTQEEIDELREKTLAQGKHFMFASRWRDANQADFPQNIPPVVRLKVPKDGATVVQDMLQGDVIVQNVHLDDMVLLRSDGTPTYMLAVVVDDHDMGITHIIRGDDHLNNASRQQSIYNALGWDIPRMVHIPLIHGPDGAKLSKRHGALGVEQYREMGYLPEAISNYLLRLGWAHGNDEFISRQQAIDWFDIKGLGKSPARIDFLKMNNINSYYIKQLSDEQMIDIVRNGLNTNLSARSVHNIIQATAEIKTRAKLTEEIWPIAAMYCDNASLSIEDDAQQIILDANTALIDKIIQVVEGLDQLDSAAIQIRFTNFCGNAEYRLEHIMKLVRALIAGRVNSPGIFNMISIIGAQESLRRININRCYYKRN